MFEKTLLTKAVFSLIVVSFVLQGPATVEDHILKNVVFVEYKYQLTDIFGIAYVGKTYSSGVIISENQLLSVCHGATKRIPGKYFAYIDYGKGYEAVELKIKDFDLMKDLALLEFERPINRAPIKLADSMKMGEDIIFAGFNSIKMPRLRYCRLTFDPYLDDKILIEPVFYGDSGGGVFNSRGQLLGIINEIIEIKKGDKIYLTLIGYATSLRITKEFLDASR